MNGRTYFAWQTRFYDHVIQDEAVLRNIRKYILDNPARWKLDTNTLEERAS
jgi:putative transposase